MKPLGLKQPSKRRGQDGVVSHQEEGNVEHDFKIRDGCATRGAVHRLIASADWKFEG